MFSGSAEKIRIKFDNSCYQIVWDRWGDEIKVSNRTQTTFEVVVTASIDNGLVTWIMLFADKAQVIYPEKLKGMVIDQAQKVLKAYT